MDFQKLLSQSKKKPQHILKLVLSFSVVILVIWLFMVSRMDLSTANTSQDPAVQARTEGLKTSLLQKKQGLAQNEGEAEPQAIAQPKQAVKEKEAPNVFQNAFVTFALMVTVMGGAWFWVKKKGASPRKKIEDERDKGAYDLGPGAQLKFVEINQEVWVLSLTAGSVNLLHRIPNAEWSENEMDISLDTEVASTADFKSFYKYFRN